MIKFGPDIGGLDCEPEIIYEMLQARNSDYDRGRASKNDLLGEPTAVRFESEAGFFKSIFLSYAFFGLALFVVSLFFTTEDITPNAKTPVVSNQKQIQNIN